MFQHLVVRNLLMNLHVSNPPSLDEASVAMAKVNLTFFVLCGTNFSFVLPILHNLQHFPMDLSTSLGYLYIKFSIAHCLKHFSPPPQKKKERKRKCTVFFSRLQSANPHFMGENNQELETPSMVSILFCHY